MGMDAFQKMTNSSLPSNPHTTHTTTQALAQVAALKKENARLEYRILHLLRALNALEAQK
jgi:hypothetical protein